MFRFDKHAALTYPEREQKARQEAAPSYREAIGDHCHAERRFAPWPNAALSRYEFSENVEMFRVRST